MRSTSHTWPIAAMCSAALVCMGCSHVPGVPKPGPDVVRPEEVLEFHTLYKQNCSGCHGEDGRNGAALQLNNPTYLAVAGAENLRTITAKGVTKTLMPPFAASVGGMLTDKQIDALVQGMLREWGRPADFAGINLPPYASSTTGNTTEGQKVFVAACARCHGVDGMGAKPTAGGKLQNGASPDPIVDPTYLSLVSDQGVRSLIIAGRPNENVPDWRSYISGPGARALTPSEINDIVAWIASQRSSLPGPSIPETGSNTTRATGKEQK